MLFRQFAILFALLVARPLVAQTPPAQQQAMNALQGIASNLQTNRDGTVRFIRFSRSNVTDAHVSQTAAFPQLDYLAVVTPNVTDAGLEHIGQLTNLDTLFLSDSGITDATVARLKSLPKLERLYLDRTRISDGGLSHLSGLTALTTLSLNQTAITDDGLLHLSGLSNLHTLVLSGTQASDACCDSLSQLSNLKVLHLDHSASTGSRLAMFSQLSALEELTLRGCAVSATAVADLRPLKSLRHLDLRETLMNEADVAELTMALPQLHISLTPPSDESRNAFQRYRAGDGLSGVVADATSPAAAANPVTDVMAPADKRFASGSSADLPEFQKHVIPLFGRLGCNGRTCHGSFQGKGGFNLSMFGYDFKADLKALTDGDEPRVDVDHVAASLILNKPTSDDDHGGGKRFAKDGWEYQLLKQWIAQGATGVAGQPAKLLAFEVTPTEIVFHKRDQTAQLRCVAVWEDGRREDVTPLTRFQTNDATMASVSDDGLVTCRLPGDTHVVSFYDNGICATQVLMPVSDHTGDRFPKVDCPTEIDRLVVRKLSQLGIVPSAVCSDDEFLRRVSLDLAGTLPSAQEVLAFRKQSGPEKREKRIDELLASDAYATWWGMQLSDLTGSNAQSLGSTDMNTPAADQWSAWLKRRVADNVGWDQIAAGIILATSRRPGQTYESYAAEQSLHLKSKDSTDYTALDNPMHYYWFRGNNQTDTDRALTFGYTFLGIRLQCAQCHKHPFDQWSKNDFEQFAGFFSRIRTGVAPDAKAKYDALRTQLGVPVKLDTAALRRQMYLRVSAEGLSIPWNEVYLAPASSKPALARVPGGPEFDLNNFADPREPLFAWLVQKDNPYFAPAFVNRVWAHHFGVGLVNPPDDFNRANPPGNKALLDWLSDEFVTHGYNLKWLHRTILSSRTYQRSSLANATNQADDHNYSRSLVRRLPAEVTIDAILRATASDDEAAGYLTNTGARKIGQHPRSFQARGIDYSLLVFGKPRRTTSCDCERQDQPTLLQSLFVRNDAEMLSWLERPDGWFNQITKGRPQLQDAASKSTASVTPPTADAAVENITQPADWIRTAYLRTLTRDPTQDEIQAAEAYIADSDDTAEGLRDVLWALLNTQEFLTNH